MVFSSMGFLFVFLPIVLMFYYNPWVKSRNYKNNVILFFSLLFYYLGEPKFLIIMLISIIIGWFIGIKIDNTDNKKLRKKWLVAGCSVHLLILIIFKYLSFAIGQIDNIFGVRFPIPDIALPIGISFFTFQLLSYLFDIYYHKAHAQNSVLKVGLYISLFPQLIAGPIVRYDAIEKQIDERKENIDMFCEGMQRFICGLIKKVLVANYIGQIADYIFSMQFTDMSAATAWLGAIAYTLQIYFDFSGYSDMAIGLGLMFGFRFAENFNYPYIAKSITDFWRRWHISLSSWFRDYIYIPLGGSRVSKSRLILNIFVVWALTGIWHGANWTFLCWGLIYFCFLMFEKLTGFTKKIGVFSRVYTLLVVVLTFVFFRSSDVTFALKYLSIMFGIQSQTLIDEYAVYCIQAGIVVWIYALVFTMPVVQILRKNINYMRIEPIFITVLFLISLLEVIGASHNPFIYFNF